MSFPVVAECWSIFESALLLQARRLVEDIAKHQKADVKALWAKVRPTIQIGLLDVDIPEEPLCRHLINQTDSISSVLERCRSPCLLGFKKCPTHISQEEEAIVEQHLSVDRAIDYEGSVYFVDASHIARDRLGVAKGIIEDDVLYVFTKSE